MGRRATVVPLLALLLSACATATPAPPAPATGAAPSTGSASESLPEDGAAPPSVLDLAGSLPLPEDSRELRPRGILPDGDDPVVAEAPGGPIRASDVARYLFRFSPDRALEALNQILDERILLGDAARHGIVLPPGLLASRVEAEVRGREKEIRIQFGPAWTLEAYLQDRFGFGVAAYRADLERLVLLQELRDRVVRLEAMAEDRIRIRVMVVEGEEAAHDAVRRLQGGADFTALARQVSKVPLQELPSYPRDEIHPPELAEELFSLPPGGVSRPVRVRKEQETVFEIFKVVEVRPGQERSWEAAREDIERDLAERPVLPAEYLQWARRARARQGVRVLLRSPEEEGTRDERE